MERPWNKELEDSGEPYYVVDTGDGPVRRLTLLFRTGQSVSIPYAYMPLIVVTAERNIQLLMHDLQVIIKGRSVFEMEYWLAEEKVVSIRESLSGHDDGTADVFVSDILIEGDLLP